MDDRELQLTREERQALEALSALQPARPSDAARARARAAFLQEAAAPELPRRASVVAMWLPLAAAAAILVMLFLYGTRPEDQWQVSALVAPAGIEAEAGVPETGTGIAGGVIETGPGSEIELVLGTSLRVRIIENSRVRLPDAPGRWFERDIEFFVEAGEIYGTSGGHSPGFPVTLATPEAEALLTGTTFAAFRTESHTCFCLFEGGMEISILATGETESLEVGKRIFVFREDGGIEVAPLDGRETMKLQMMQDAGPPTDD